MEQTLNQTKAKFQQYEKDVLALQEELKRTGETPELRAKFEKLHLEVMNNFDLKALTNFMR